MMDKIVQLWPYHNINLKQKRNLFKKNKFIDIKNYGNIEKAGPV